MVAEAQPNPVSTQLGRRGQRWGFLAKPRPQTHLEVVLSHQPLDSVVFQFVGELQDHQNRARYYQRQRALLPCDLARRADVDLVSELMRQPPET
jgi:hypothetical protein